MKELKTHAGFPIEPVYGPEHLAGRDVERDIGRPGEYPFTRGIHKQMYRDRLWTMRQYIGFGTPQETNARFGARRTTEPKLATPRPQVCARCAKVPARTPYCPGHRVTFFARNFSRFQAVP